MKATELRIGNLIEKSLKSGQGRKLIDKIKCQDIVRIFENTGSFNYEPIPLTEKWLLKFGFERIEQDDKGNEYCNILYSLNGFDLWFFDFWKSFESKISIKQVHQLQNLYFALT